MFRYLINQTAVPISSSTHIDPAPIEPVAAPLSLFSLGFAPDLYLSSLLDPPTMPHSIWLQLLQLHDPTRLNDYGPLTIAVLIRARALPIHPAAIPDVARLTGAGFVHTRPVPVLSWILAGGLLVGLEVGAEAEFVGDYAEDGLEGGETAAPEADVAF